MIKVIQEPGSRDKKKEGDFKRIQTRHHNLKPTSRVPLPSLLVVILVLLGSIPTNASGFAGGSGTPDDPFQIATAEQLIDMGKDPNLYHNHFVLIDDIDLDGHTFTEAVIATGRSDSFEVYPKVSAFTGSFDGNGHVIQNLHIQGTEALGLFGVISPGAYVSNLCLLNVEIIGSDSHAGALASYIDGGSIVHCYSTGSVQGGNRVGGLVGGISNGAGIVRSYSTSTVNGIEVVGGLVGINEEGSVVDCYSTGSVNGLYWVGGLLGLFIGSGGSIIDSYSTGNVTGEYEVGGLVGTTNAGYIGNSYSTGNVTGEYNEVGGLVGNCSSNIVNCYSTSPVTGNQAIGGLMGINNSQSSITWCYSTGLVSGYGGGLVGYNEGTVRQSYWDVNSSGQDMSAGGTGLSTLQMQNPQTYLKAGWHFVDEGEDSLCDGWQMPEEGGYPVLCSWLDVTPVRPDGQGTLEDPHRIKTAVELDWMRFFPMAHYQLAEDIDLSGTLRTYAVIPWFGGTIDGNGHTIRNLHIEGIGENGFFGVLGHRALVRHLRIVHVDINGIRVFHDSLEDQGDKPPGGGRRKLAMDEEEIFIRIINNDFVGGLTGRNWGYVLGCSSEGSITGRSFVGGLVGENYGTIISSNSTSSVKGEHILTGGLVGLNVRDILHSYAANNVNGVHFVGGLVGLNVEGRGSIRSCYSTGAINGAERVGGLVGYRRRFSSFGVFFPDDSNPASEELLPAWLQIYYQSLDGVNDPDYYIPPEFVNPGTFLPGRVQTEEYDPPQSIFSSFWEIDSSGAYLYPDPNVFYPDPPALFIDDMGRYRDQMQDMQTYLDADWDFVGETENGTSDYWQMSVQTGYPVLSIFNETEPVQFAGQGTTDDPFIITNATELGAVWRWPDDHYRLDADIDLTDITWKTAVVPRFGGTFDGNGHRIKKLSIVGTSNLGLFGMLANAHVSDLGLWAVDVNGFGHNIGGLVGECIGGSITRCYSTGRVQGIYNFGGLVGKSSGHISNSYSTGNINEGSVSFGIVLFGGLLGSLESPGSVINCYTTTKIIEDPYFNNLVGENSGGHIIHSFWEDESATNRTGGSTNRGVALPKEQMQDIQTFLDAEWDFVGETANGTEDIWAIPPKQYPRLAWEQVDLDTAYSGGSGTEEDPYQLSTAEDLLVLSHYPSDWDKYFILTEDIDLMGIKWSKAVIAPANSFYYDDPSPESVVFSGSFDGKGHVIRHLSIEGAGCLGLFGMLSDGACISNLGLEDVEISSGTGHAATWVAHGSIPSRVGALAGHSDSSQIVNCYSTGTVNGYWHVGGLVGSVGPEGSIVSSYSSGSVNRNYSLYPNGSDGAVGGRSVIIVPFSKSVDDPGMSNSIIIGSSLNPINDSLANAIVGWEVRSIGGLAGANLGKITGCYSTASVAGYSEIGGLVGTNSGRVGHCYSAGSVIGENGGVGGFIGTSDIRDSIIHCFWDIESSGKTQSQGGTGLVTELMMDADYLSLNGWGGDPNWILDSGHDYPRLAWEGTLGDPIPEPELDWIQGDGTAMNPYVIVEPNQFQGMSKVSLFWDRHITLGADIDMSGMTWSHSILPEFSGTFDGNDFMIQNLTIAGDNLLGLIGNLHRQGTVQNLSIVDANVTGTGDTIGILVGRNEGQIIQCNIMGSVQGSMYVGGLVGRNEGGMIQQCYTNGTVSGSNYVGGLMGCSAGGAITDSNSISTIISTGEQIGDLIGGNCYGGGGR